MFSTHVLPHHRLPPILLEERMLPFTPDSKLDLLFSPDLIPEEVKSQLHPDVHVRWRGYFIVTLLIKH